MTMGENTKIEWCHHTFNPWRGCQKVSPGCAHCYAETLSLRNPAVLGEWGPNGTRVVASESYWRQPLAWDRAAARAGERRRVFCASLADVFEDWQGPMEDARGVQIWKRGDGGWTTSDHYRDTVALAMTDVRARLFALIERTPSLDWLILTKRPENVQDMVPPVSCSRCFGGPCDPNCPERGRVRPNVWLGVSVEDQERANKRIPILAQIPAAVRFLSVEPLLEDLGRLDLTGIDWVIVGGESGPGARPMALAWARSVVAQCREAGVPCFVKQLGSVPMLTGMCDNAMLARDGDLMVEASPDLRGFRVALRDRKGGKPAEWPPDLRVREFPHSAREMTP